jgi:hypothetical protein
MSELKIPVTMKIMYVGAILLAGVGISIDDDISVVLSVVILVILSCAVSILEGLHKGFEELIRLEINNILEQKGDK